MNTNRTAAGTKFRVLLGMPRDCVVTRVTVAHVYFTSTRAGGKSLDEVMPRSMMSNTAMIEMRS